MSKFNRLQVLINLIISRPGIKAPELSKETGVCERTIYRDLAALSAQYPIKHNDGYSLAPSMRLRPLTLTKAEYDMLQLALSSPALQRPDFRPIACSLKAKIDAVVEAGIRDSSIKCNLYAPLRQLDPKEAKRVSAYSDVLQRAVSARTAVSVLYQDNQHIERLNVYPYHLVYDHPHWILVGFVACKDAFEALRLTSIEEITLTNQPFLRDNNFSLEQYFQSKWELKAVEQSAIRVNLERSAVKGNLSEHNDNKKQVARTAKKRLRERESTSELGC